MEERAQTGGLELPEQLRLLESNAKDLIRRGLHDDAEQLYRQILQAAPRHVPGLRYLAGRALARNELDDAQTLIEQAIQIMPAVPMLHQNLGVVLRARGYFEGALMAFDTALRFEPRAVMVWVQRGDVLQALNRLPEALAAYAKAEELCGDLRVFAQATRGFPRGQQRVQRAAVALARARQDDVQSAVAPLLRRHGAERLARAQQAVRTMTQSALPAYTDPLQRPAFAYFPGLAARPFFKRNEFPFLDELEKRSDVIAAELKAILARSDDLRPYIEVPEGREGQWTELNRSRKWSSYHLYKNGERVAEHCARCPRTVETVESLPLVRMQGQAPEIFFSILEPRTHIPPHFGLGNYKLAVHLPLIIPPACAIRVGDQTQTWARGKCLIFDDSFEHEAWNRSDELRAVLILECWNPQLSDEECEYLSTAASALDRFNRKTARLRPPIVGGG